MDHPYLFHKKTGWTNLQPGFVGSSPRNMLIHDFPQFSLVISNLGGPIVTWKNGWDGQMQRREIALRAGVPMKTRGQYKVVPPQWCL